MAKSQEYDYALSGFDPFFTRSIDSNGASNLDASGSINTSQQVNYDQNQVTGALGDILKIGNIQINGVTGRISIFDDDGREAVTIGDISAN